MSKSPEETIIQGRIQQALGAEHDFLLMRNTVGKVEYSDDEGNLRKYMYGLGTGSPDLVGILRIKHRGYVLAGIWLCFEVKVPGEVASPHQEKIHAIWRRFGAQIHVVTSVEEARAALESTRRLFA